MIFEVLHFWVLLFLPHCLQHLQFQTPYKIDLGALYQPDKTKNSIKVYILISFFLLSLANTRQPKKAKETYINEFMKGEERVAEVQNVDKLEP